MRQVITQPIKAIKVFKEVCDLLDLVTNEAKTTVNSLKTNGVIVEKAFSKSPTGKASHDTSAT